MCYLKISPNNMYYPLQLYFMASSHYLQIKLAATGNIFRLFCHSSNLNISVLDYSCNNTHNSVMSNVFYGFGTMNLQYAMEHI